MKQMTEEDLVQGLKQRDPMAIQQAFLNFYPPILAYVSHSVSNSGDAEDIAREALYVLCLKANSLPWVENVSNLRAFLYCVAKNKVGSYLRAKIQADAFMKDYIGTAAFGHGLHEEAKTILENELHFEIHKFLHTLTGQAKDVMDLLYNGNYTIKEVGEKLGTSQGNVRNQHYRVIVKLREIVGKYQVPARSTGSLLKALVGLWACIHVNLN